MSGEQSIHSEKGRWVELLRGQLGVYTLVVNLGVFAFSINTFVVAGIMPTVVADIGGMRLYAWTFALFSVGSVIGAAASGPLAGMLGLRATNIWGGAIFLAGLVAAALAPTMEMLVAVRFLQGLGGGILASQGYAIIATLFPERLRGHGIVFTSTAWGCSNALGPAVGGVFAEMGQWRGAFWSLTPLVLAFIVLAARSLPGRDATARRMKLPYRRLAMLAASVLLLSWTSQADDVLVRAALIVAAVALAVATFRRDAHATNPIVPPGMLDATRELGQLSWILLLNSTVVTFVNTYATLHMQVLHGATPLVASYFYVAVSAGWSVSSFAVPNWRGRRELFGIVLGLAIVLAGSLATGYFVIQGPIWVIVASMFVLGIGIGFMNSLVMQRAIRAAPPERRQLAGGAVQTMRNLGIAFGAAAVGLVAVSAGLAADTATPEMVARAMAWVYGGAGVVALVSLLFAVPLMVKR